MIVTKDNVTITISFGLVSPLNVNIFNFEANPH